MQNYSIAYDFLTGLTGDPDNCVIDFRAIHETDKGTPALITRGTLAASWQWITTYNNQGYGIFAVIAAMDGVGRELNNVAAIRAHYIDLDNISAFQNAERALSMQPAPSMLVNSSPGKFHVYWTVNPYTGNEYFQALQRKFYTFFNGDRIIDATRVMRLPGTLHLKNPAAPHLVTMQRAPAFGFAHDVTTLAAALAHVNVIDTGHGTRHDLGDTTLAAPSIEWLQAAIDYIDPDTLDRADWIAITAAIKQSGWTLENEGALLQRYLKWCSRYHKDNVPENLKQWDSIRNTETGWKYLLRRAPPIAAAFMHAQRPDGGQGAPWPMSGDPVPPGVPVPVPSPDAPAPTFGVFLDPMEQQQYFNGCMFVVNLGEILVGNGRFLNNGQFNAVYGGKQFIIDAEGKLTDEAWKAATRSTMWRIPIVDHVRFMPSAPPRAIITDDLGREGVNVYRPARVMRTAGDPSRFLWHIAQLLPVDGDRKILLDFLAHNVKYPGFKIPWAPVIQSAEGAGKGLLKAVMTNAIGRSYVYFPNAKELTNSGSQFNAWMRHKLFILADEIKVDDRRDLIEVLKPMISEKLIEVQAKGENQGLEDNFANWCFFTNWKDAIPITKNGRRYSVNYSALQTVGDMISRGMTEQYFKSLYDWIEGEGGPIISDYLMNYPIARGDVPMRGPDTSSTAAAIELTRSPIEKLIISAIDEGMPGFRGGWVSVVSVIKRATLTKAVRGILTPQTAETVLEGLGYVNSGRASRPYFQEDKDIRSTLYHLGCVGDINTFGPWQGWG